MTSRQCWESDVIFSKVKLYDKAKFRQACFLEVQYDENRRV